MKTALSWSSGKDSALALDALLNAGNTVELFTTVHGDSQVVAMHGTQIQLLRAQARALDLDIDIISLPDAADNETYGRLMDTAMRNLKNRGFDAVAFGDIALEDVKKYREDHMAHGLRAVFPLWGLDTRDLALDIVDRGFKAVVAAVDGSVLDPDFLGREYDLDFLRNLPPDVDPAGENGEFHTFCYDGPCFRHAVGWSAGERTFRDFPMAAGNSSDEEAEVKRVWYLSLQPR